MTRSRPHRTLRTGPVTALAFGLAAFLALATARPAGADLPAGDEREAGAAPAVPLAAAASASDDDVPFRISLPTVADVEAWREAGFRIQLGYGYGAMFGVNGTPNATTQTFLLRAGARLDDDWSLLASFAYAAARGGVVGLRFMGTIDPTWHLGDHLELALGAGFGGLVEGFTGRDDPDVAQRDALVASYTYPNTDHLLRSCTGIGAAALLRLGWAIVLGPLSAGVISLQADGQWIACEESLGRVEPDTARPIVRRQWWPHLGGNVTWTFAWR